MADSFQCKENGFGGRGVVAWIQGAAAEVRESAVDGGQPAQEARQAAVRPEREFPVKSAC
jgi:hypothetical protein